MAQRRIQKQKTEQKSEEPKPAKTAREKRNEGRKLAQDTEYAEAVKHEMDAILEEIDEVLEENAEEFVKTYVQKGGQ